MRAVAKDVPIEKILLETDAPYLAPQKLRGQRNEPSYLVNTAKAISEVLSVTEETVAEKTTANARKVLKINM